MGRIRTVKPEFWEDEKVGDLSPTARLLFIGTWNLADDEGLLRWTDDYINASLFMYDGLAAKRVQSLMAELVAAELVFPYLGGKARQQLAYVVNFRKHQKINRPQPGRFPAPSVQSGAVRQMYAARDLWTCHLCGGPINRLDDGHLHLSSDLDLSLDHLVPRTLGGSDYPSNIRASHVACNKSRRDRPLEQFQVPHSVREFVPDARNGSVNHSRTGSSPDQGSGSGSGNGSRISQGSTDLTRIQKRLNCDAGYAERAAKEILSKAPATVLSPTAYVLAAIDADPARFRPTATAPRFSLCEHGVPPGACGDCIEEAAR